MNLESRTLIYRRTLGASWLQNSAVQQLASAKISIVFRFDAIPSKITNIRTFSDHGTFIQGGIQKLLLETIKHAFQAYKTNETATGKEPIFRSNAVLNR
ncbi:MAG TPA: hypothetical protein VHS96_17300 [Bacteroidia bacterium]|nr:hypothetical protein [Bacteroidia bacterium]